MRLLTISRDHELLFSDMYTEELEGSTCFIASLTCFSTYSKSSTDILWANGIPAIDLTRLSSISCKFEPWWILSLRADMSPHPSCGYLNKNVICSFCAYQRKKQYFVESKGWVIIHPTQNGKYTFYIKYKCPYLSGILVWWCSSIHGKRKSLNTSYATGSGTRSGRNLGRRTGLLGFRSPQSSRISKKFPPLMHILKAPRG